MRTCHHLSNGLTYRCDKRWRMYDVHMILPTMTMSTTTTATTTIVMLMIMIASARTSLPCFAFLFPYDVGPIEWRKFHWTETKRTKLNRKEIYIEHIFSIPFYFTHTHTHVCSKAIFYSYMFAKVNLYSQALFKCGTLISYFFHGKFMKSSLLLLLLERIFSSIIITVDFSFQEIFVLLSCHKVCMACMA